MAPALASPLPPDDPEDDRRGNTMSLLGHLEELRKRLIRSCLGAGAGMILAFFFIDRIVNFVLAPARHRLPPGSKLIYTEPGEAFSLYLQVALLAGAVLASPFIMYQVWRFIAPALYAKEKRLVIPFVALTTAGGVGGAMFSHYVVFPAMIAFFGLFSSPTLAFMPRLADVMDLYVKLLIGMALVFQIPTVVYFLARMGLVTARFLWRHVQYAVLVIFIVAAVLTPSSDPYNQLVFAAPMVALYLLSIGVAWLAAPRRPQGAGS